MKIGPSADKPIPQPVAPAAPAASDAARTTPNAAAARAVANPPAAAAGATIELSSAASNLLTAGVGKLALYVGPKDPDVLGAARPDLASVVDFGFFATFAKLLLAALRFFSKIYDQSV